MSVGTIPDRVALLQRWLDLSSVANAPTPLGGILSVGQFGCVVPVDFNARPPTEFDLQAMPIFVAFDQCDGTGIGTDDFDPEAPDTHKDIADRLSHLCWKITGGELPPLCVVGLETPDEPISAAVERAALGPVALEAPTIALPLWQLADGPRRRLAATLPYRPAPGAVDPAIDDEPVRQPDGVGAVWP